jgi:hypothetical protein
MSINIVPVNLQLMQFILTGQFGESRQRHIKDFKKTGPEKAAILFIFGCS